MPEFHKLTNGAVLVGYDVIVAEGVSDVHIFFCDSPHQTFPVREYICNHGYVGICVSDNKNVNADGCFVSFVIRIFHVSDCRSNTVTNKCYQ